MIGLDAVTAAGVPARLEIDLTATPAELLVGQRTRLAARLAKLGARGWRRGTRCPLWDVADVVIHLVNGTDWALETLTAAETGAAVPRFLQGFDPVNTPHEHVLAGRGQQPEVLLARLHEATQRLASRLHGAQSIAEPCVPWVGGSLMYAPGLVGLHVLWDSWLHESDLDAALSAEGIAAAAPCPTELDAVAAYGIFFAGIIARALNPHAQVSLHLDLAELGYDLRVGELVRLRRACPDPAAGALLIRGPAGATVAALAGRGELAEVTQADTQAITLISALAARMRGPAARTPVGQGPPKPS